jgi:hypothetical protein
MRAVQRFGLEMPASIGNYAPQVNKKNMITKNSKTRQLAIFGRAQVIRHKPPKWPILSESDADIIVSVLCKGYSSGLG